MTQQYEDRIRRVLKHIHDNPHEDLSLDCLCDIAAMSRFHWHRVFHAMTGETCAEVVRRVRTHRAAGLLVQSDLNIEEIARKTGFSNRQSFARTFQEQFAMTPAQFRKEGCPGQFSIHLRKGLCSMFDVDVREEGALRLIGLKHEGDYHAIGSAFEQVGAAFAARNLWPKSKGMVGVYYDDPSSVEVEKLRSFAGVAVSEDLVTPDGLEDLDIPGGPRAVLRFKGPYAGLKAAYDYLYGEWLPASRRVPDDMPPYEMYLNSPMDTAPTELLTDICAPLQALE